MPDPIHKFIVAAWYNRHAEAVHLVVLLYVGAGLPLEMAQSLEFSADDFLCGNMPPSGGLWLWEGEGSTEENDVCPEEPYWYPTGGTWRRPTGVEMGMAWGEEHLG